MKAEHILTLRRGETRSNLVAILRTSWAPVLDVKLADMADAASLVVWLQRCEVYPDTRIDWRLTACMDCLAESEPCVETSTYLDTSGASRAALLVKTSAREDAASWLLEGRIHGNADTLQVALLVRLADPRGTHDGDVTLGPAAG